jgi:hypothetical protein
MERSESLWAQYAGTRKLLLHSPFALPSVTFANMHVLLLLW